MTRFFYFFIFLSSTVFSLPSWATGKCDLTDLKNKICQPVDFSKKRDATETEQGCFFSSGIGREVCYSVTFPKNYPSKETTPYTVFLHGRGADHQQFADFCRTCSTTKYAKPCFDKEGPPSLIIAPSETTHTYWKNSPDGKINGAALIYKDLVQHVESQSNKVRKDPSGRGLMGISMGGHGATYISMLHPEIFSGGLYAISPVFRDEAGLAPEDVVGFGKGSQFRQRDPSALLKQNHKILSQLPFKMEIAPDDGFYNPGSSTRLFFNSIKSFYPKNVTIQGSGGHSLTYWCGALQRSMSFFKERYSKLPAPKESTKINPTKN